MHTPLWIAATIGALGLTAGTLYVGNSADQADAAAKKRMMMEQSAPAAPGQKQAEKKPVVVEFFTSQGCSSCPPADRLAAKLAKEDGLLVIERPVTYWDRLGWRDTLGKQANTNLQRAYARRGLEGRNGVYTPQAVVSGREGVVGSREDALRTLVGRERHRDAPDIMLSRGVNGTVQIAVDGKPGQSGRLQLVGLDRSETVKIGRGENGGRSVTYTNVWKGEKPLGQLANQSLDYTLANNERDIDGANAYAVILRDGADGPILAGKILPDA
ncbi:DUF1223 domain-containing protein [Qipengyuania sp. DSG2-2]|uniref:DUF1223 domain-containing protein n=1 Tax=Qipengyuania sp. DGS2-2 TaxID=3349631 RepID=UPI0036D2E3E6